MLYCCRLSATSVFALTAYQLQDQMPSLILDPARPILPTGFLLPYYAALLLSMYYSARAATYIPLQPSFPFPFDETFFIVCLVLLSPVPRLSDRPSQELQRPGPILRAHQKNRAQKVYPLSASAFRPELQVNRGSFFSMVWPRIDVLVLVQVLARVLVLDRCFLRACGCCCWCGCSCCCCCWIGMT